LTLPDAPQGYLWVESLLNRARRQVKPQTVDFFEGAEATWQDIVAAHDVVRDVQGDILAAVQAWRDRGDRMTMALIQGRSGDGKSTVLKRVATELVGLGYGVLWHRGQGSLNCQGLEDLTTEQDVVVCVDDLTKVLPEQIEQTLRDLQDVSARVFWLVTVRDDLWGGTDVVMEQLVKLLPFSVRELSDREIGGLLDRLTENGALGQLASLSREAQEAKLRDGADRQLLVALLEAKYNESLKAYVLRNLRDLEQRFGKVVGDACSMTCAVQRFGLEMPIEYLQELLGISSLYEEVFSKTEGFLYPPSPNDFSNGVRPLSSFRS
jgi:hypothetical protein